MKIFEHFFDYRNIFLRLSKHFSLIITTSLFEKSSFEKLAYILVVLAASKTHNFKKNCGVY